MNIQILALSPGSTSTKVALFDGTREVDCTTLRHKPEELSLRVWEQFELRLHGVREWVGRQRFRPTAIVALGGLFRPVEGGVYRVNEEMLADARRNVQGEHASNLGCAMADALARDFQAEAFIVDPVSVDEFEPLARYSGHPLIQRRSLSHALNIHAVVERAAAEQKKPVSESAYVVAHLGGGISIAAVRGGRIIDVNDASSDGPFSPERTGGLPLQPFISLCYSGAYSEAEMRRLVMGNGGIVAYLGTTSLEEVERRIAEGDREARIVFEAMVYQIGKEIGAMAAVLCGRLDAVVVTGGLAHSGKLVTLIRERAEFLAPLIVYPGEEEMQTLARRALNVLLKNEEPKVYAYETKTD